MKKPKPARKSKKPMREVALSVPEKTCEMFARTIRVIEREYGSAPSVEALGTSALAAGSPAERRNKVARCK